MYASRVSAALKGLVLPHASHSGEIARSGSRRLRSTLAAALVVFAHAAAAVAKRRKSTTLKSNNACGCSNTTTEQATNSTMCAIDVYVQVLVTTTNTVDNTKTTKPHVTLTSSYKAGRATTGSKCQGFRQAA
jgi:hypothetical protein